MTLQPRDVHSVDAARAPLGRYRGAPAHPLAAAGSGTGPAAPCTGVGQGLALVLER